jgi:ribosomal protein S18 acetylase RimI-like enzyme
MDIRRLNAEECDLAFTAIAELKIADESRSADGLDREYLSTFLAVPTNILIVASIERLPVGFLMAYQLQRVDRDRKMMLLYEIGVTESYRRRGTAAAMIDLLKKYCRENEILKMWVYTNRYKRAATALYRSTGGVAATSGDEVSFLYTAQSFL